MEVDEPIDYEKTRFEDVVHNVDVVLDTVGGDTQKRSWKMLKKCGIPVSIVAPPSAEEPAKHSVRSTFLAGHPVLHSYLKSQDSSMQGN